MYFLLTTMDLARFSILHTSSPKCTIKCCTCQFAFYIATTKFNQYDIKTVTVIILI